MIDLRFSGALLGGVIALAAVAAIVASSAVVLFKDKQARLTLDIEGVPGYVYYGQDYEVTFVYSNVGGMTAEAAELSAVLPGDFSFDGRIGEIVWQLGSIAPGESGAVTATLRGSVPADLSEAVYDLPGYEGHTALVDGLSIEAVLTSGEAEVATHALADTGETQAGCEATAPDYARCLVIIKETDPPGDTQDFEFEHEHNGAMTDFELEDGEMEAFTLGDDEPHTVTETVPEGWVLTDIDCDDSQGVDVNEGDESVTVTVDLGGAEFASAVCIFHNEREPTPTPTATATTTATPTATPTGTQTPPTITPVPPTATSAPPSNGGTIIPPSTGSGALR